MVRRARTTSRGWVTDVETIPAVTPDKNLHAGWLGFFVLSTGVY